MSDELASESTRNDILRFIYSINSQVELEKVAAFLESIVVDETAPATEGIAGLWNWKGLEMGANNE